jgi:hypothetical protein
MSCFIFSGNLMATYAQHLKKGGGIAKKGRKKTHAESLQCELSTDHEAPTLQIKTRAMANRKNSPTPNLLIQGGEVQHEQVTIDDSEEEDTQPLSKSLKRKHSKCL